MKPRRRIEVGVSKQRIKSQEDFLKSNLTKKKLKWLKIHNEDYGDEYLTFQGLLIETKPVIPYQGKSSKRNNNLPGRVSRDIVGFSAGSRRRLIKKLFRWTYWMSRES